MNYIQLAQRLGRECDVPGGAPLAIAGQVGESRRLVDWIASAYDEIQGKHRNWQWLRSEFSVNTVAGTDAYASSSITDTVVGGTIRFRSWWPFDSNGRSNVKIYLQSAGVGTERWLPWLPWANFRALYKLGTQNNGQPAHFTIDPRLKLVIGPKPDAVYVVSGEYQRGPQTLASDTDTPEMPVSFHMLIVYEAMLKYAGFDAASEVFQRAAMEGGRLWRQLELDQLPAVTIGEPMA